MPKSLTSSCGEGRRVKLGECVELPPNEYKKSGDPEHRESYRLAIVRNALTRDRKCAIYEKDGADWRRPDKEGGNDKGAPDFLVTERVDAARIREPDSDE